MSLPEPLGPVRVLGRPGSAETYRQGASITVRSTWTTASQATRQADLERAADWLGKIHGATATGSVSLGSTGLDFGGLTDRYARIFGSDDREGHLFRDLRERVIVDGGQLVPQVMRHRDFGPWNVLIDTDGRLSIIDWEVAGPGPPLVDLVYFVAHWCWTLTGSRGERSRARLLSHLVSGRPLGWQISAARSVIVRHARHLGLAPESVAALFAWTFIEQALDRHDRLLAIGDPAAADRASNRYVRYVVALAEEPDLVGTIAGWLDPERDRDR